MPITAPPKADQTSRADKAPAALVPFTRAAYEHVEPFHDSSAQLGAASIAQSPIDIPAVGYARAVVLLVTLTGGAQGAAVVAGKEDAPFSVLDEIVIRDVNGVPIVGPVNGYEAFLKQKWLPNTEWGCDPRASVVYSGIDASGNATFLVRLPLEIGSRDGLGSLPNQNSASTYKLEFTRVASSTLYTTAPATTLPTVRVRAFLEAWTQPSGTDLRGRPQAVTPPALGTTQFIRHEVKAISSGENTLRLSRVGNLVRGLIFVLRTAAGARSDANWPDQLRVSLDSRQLLNLNKTYWQHLCYERYGFDGAIDAENGRDTGVYVLDFAHDFDGRVGGELRDLYLPTTQGTRLELEGSFGAAGDLTVIYNDVRPGAGEIAID